MKLTNLYSKVHLPNLHVPQMHFHMPHVHMNQLHMPSVPFSVQRSIFNFFYVVMIMIFIFSLFLLIAGIYDRGF